MIKGLTKLHPGEPACQQRSDGDHLRFVIHCKDKDDHKFGFTIELNGVKSWVVPDVPSMNPLDQRIAREDSLDKGYTLEACLDSMWDKGNYIPFDDHGNVLSENEATECLKEGVLKFFLQGTKLVGEFVLMRRGKKSWLLMKRHDEFALYNSYSFKTLVS